MASSRRKTSITIIILAAAVVAASFLNERVRLAGLALIGHSPHCSFVQAVQSADHARRLRESKDRILAASKLVETDAEGFRCWQTPRGKFWIPPHSDWGLPFNLAEQENKIYGTGEQAVRAGDVVLDCGANIGVYVREALDSGAKIVVAIEPAPENLKCLRLNFPKEIAEGKVIVYPKGVWNKDDFLTINVDTDNPAADSFVLHQKGASEGMKLPLTTIDKMVEELKLDRVDYIKMDIEGAEQNALIGGRQTIAKFHPRLSLSTYHLPDDPVKIPELVHQAWPGYRTECGPCAYANGTIRPDVLYFR